MTNTLPIPLLDEIPKISLSDIFELIDQTARGLRRIQRQTVSEADLTPPQYAILSMLWEQDGRPFKELADALVCTRATITGLIDTLEGKGLVERRPNLKDRRSLLATLTEAGWAMKKRTPSLERTYQSCCSGLTPLEFQQLAFLLNKLNDSFTYEEVIP